MFSLAQEVVEGGGLVRHQPRGSGGVHAGGWVEPVGSAGAGDVPVVVVQQHVVVAAEQDPISQIGFPVIAGPLVNVVGFRPGGGAVAAGEGAAAVAGFQGAPDRGRGRVGEPAHIEWLAVCAEYDRDDSGVTGQSAGGLGGDRPGQAHLPTEGGKVAVEGWAEASSLGAIELARKFEGEGVAAIIYTDIDRDGILTAPTDFAEVEYKLTVATAPGQDGLFVTKAPNFLLLTDDALAARAGNRVVVGGRDHRARRGRTVGRAGPLR